MRARRLLLLFFVTVMILTAMSGSTVQAASKEEMTEIVESEINKYAKSIAQSNSNEQTLIDMLYFSMLHGGEHYNANEKQALTATLFNSNLLKYSLRKAIVNSIMDMNTLGLEEIYAMGELSWYDGSYYSNIYSFTGPSRKEEGKVRTVGGGNLKTGVNNHDRSLVLVVGGSRINTYIRKVEVKSETIVYDISVKVYDDFDFNATYDNMKRDTSVAKLLTGIGKASLNEYTWEANGSFQVELPYTCDHMQGNYQWILDYDTKSMISTVGNDFTVNSATTIEYENSAGKMVYYYSLEEPVKLYHKEPWVIEYTGNRIASLYLVPFESSSSNQMYFAQSAYISSFIKYIPENLTEQEKELLAKDPDAKVVRATYHYNGMDNTELIKKYYSQYDLTYRMENKIASDGTNTVYLSIWATSKKGETQQLLEATPLNLYAKRTNTDTKRSDFAEGEVWSSGQDWVIGHIGYKNASVSAQRLQLTIWTNGENTRNTSSYEEIQTTGTCVTPSITADMCMDCNHKIIKHSEMGDHSFGSYKSNNDATCTKDATKTATCKYCGLKKTVTIKNSALGHIPQKVRDCSATCILSGFIGGQVCTRCDEVVVPNTIIPAKGHDFGEWTVTKKPSCTKEGLERRDCKVCNYYEERVAAMTEHVWKDDYTVDKPATYEEEGSMTIRCSICHTENGHAVISKLGKISCDTIFAYTGKQSVPTLTVKDINGDDLVEGTDYKYVIRNTKNAIVREPKAIGNYVVHITYMGKYSGEDRLNYSIVPATVRDVKVKLTAHDDVQVSWSKADLAEGYLIYYKTASAKKYTLYGSTAETGVTIKNLADNTTYNFKVVSYATSNGVKVEGKSSSVVKNKTLKDLVKPKSVTLKLTAHDDIKVSWKKVQNAEGYYVYYKKATATKYTSYKVTTKTSITLKNLADNTKYDIKIVPYGVSNGNKVKSDRFTEKSIKTLRNLKAPQKMELKATGKTGLKVTWNKSLNAKGYYVYYKITGTDSYKFYKTTKMTSLTISGLKKNTKYTVKVVPYGISDDLKVQSDNYSVKSLKTKK